MANTFKFGNGEWAVGKETVLAYNSENNNFKPLPFSFDRASTATVVNKDGLIETVGVDEPRIDFLNNTKGHLLLEPQRRNLVINSENFAGSGWNNFASITPIANSTISPEGVQNASTLECSGNNVFRYSFTASSSTNYVGSVFVKAKETTNDFGIQTLESGTPHVSVFNIESGVVVTQASNHIASIKDYGNGWFRCSVKFNSGSSTSNIFDFKGSQTTDNKEFYAWGAQIEEGNYATSYIPTSGLAVTRSAETAVDSGNTNVFNDSEGVLYADIAALADVLSFQVLSISDGGVTNSIGFGYRTSSNVIYTFVGSAINSSTSVTVSDITLQNKVAVKYKSGSFAMWINGFEVYTSPTAFTISGISQLSFDNGAGSADFYGKVKDIRYYNTALSDSELQALTT